MRILISCHVLDRSGTPTYTLTMWRELKRRGHDVIVYSPLGGSLSKVLGSVNHLSFDAPDVILAQMNCCAEEMSIRFPNAPMLFLSHGFGPDTETPPKCEVRGYVAINEDVRERLIKCGADPERVIIVRDFVDTDEFAPKTEVGQKLQRVLYISNYKKWRSWAHLEKACAVAGVQLRGIGAPYGRSRDVAADINSADIVVTTGRGLIEAMACGRPVISFDQMNGDGYLTPDIYMESRTRNFFGVRCRHIEMTYKSLVSELRKFNAADGAVNRALAVEHHGHVAGVDQLLAFVGAPLAQRQRQQA